jgi:hypothetical protein
MTRERDRGPAPPAAGWAETCATLHRWPPVVRKVRLALAPPENHWWQGALYVSARGLTSSPMPYRGGTFEIGSTSSTIRWSSRRAPALAAPSRSCRRPSWSSTGYDTTLNALILKHDDMRSLPSRHETLLEFLQTTYDAGAGLANWNRAELEAPAVRRGR